MAWSAHPTYVVVDGRSALMVVVLCKASPSATRLPPGLMWRARSRLPRWPLRGTARVVEAAPEIDGRLHWVGVKTHEARTVRLPRSICEELGAYLGGRPSDPEALVFRAPLGGPLRPHTWVKSFFKPALRAAGLPEGLRLYDLRHTCASLLIAQGASVKAVQAQLGHATASITLDTYGHLFLSELEALADRLEQARTAALANRARTQRGPTIVALGEGAGR
jgi:integrase